MLWMYYLYNLKAAILSIDCFLYAVKMAFFCFLENMDWILLLTDV